MKILFLKSCAENRHDIDLHFKFICLGFNLAIYNFVNAYNIGAGTRVTKRTNSVIQTF